MAKLETNAQSPEEGVNSQDEVTVDPTAVSDESYPFGVDGPPQALISEWKDQGYVIYAAPIADTVFVYRRITRPEHRALLEDGTVNAEDFDDEIVKRFVMWPLNADEINWDTEHGAGAVGTLANNIMMCSGFGNQSTPMKL